MTVRSTSVVGFAACTSLGHSLDATLAAMGAGLTNFTATAARNPFGDPIAVASVVDPELPRAQRLTALAERGLDDLNSTWPVVELKGVPLVIGLADDLDEAEQRAVNAVIAERGDYGPASWFPYGRASSFAALETAVEWISSGRHRRVIVGGIDSLCAPSTVSRLSLANRVLGPYTEGTIPGEAASFALLARPDDAFIGNGQVLRIAATACVRGRAFSQATRVEADALATAFGLLREGCVSRVEHVVAAHSGEGYFSRVFSHAYLRHVEIMPEPLSVELTADRVGDVGAASGVLGLAFAVYLLTQDAGRGEGRALVYSESDNGEVGAAVLEGTCLDWRRGPYRS